MEDAPGEGCASLLDLLAPVSKYLSFRRHMMKITVKVLTFYDQNNLRGGLGGGAPDNPPPPIQQIVVHNLD